ncbi:MAG: hypothetical protein J6I72_08015 [Muribaculaceae bacterium]|nr:hypothetical protein [Muribaculaceae bacterium]
MKKFIYLGAVAAMLLGTASCSSDMEPQLADGTVQFKVELPGGFESRAISDGTTATKLDVACYDADGNKLAVEPTVKTDFENRVATVTYKLVKGQKYNFAFFAHADGAPYTFTPGENMDGCEFEVNYTGGCNDEKRDAFYATVKDYEVTATTTDVTLYRPFAQLNFGADDLEAAAAAGITPSQSMVTVKKAATTFGLFTEEATGEADVEYALAALPNDPATLTVEGKDYAWMEMCYFLVPDNEANVDVEMTVKTNKADVVVPVASVPMKKNHRTNIVGSLFTQESNFRIIIDQNFDNYDYDIVNGKLMLKAGMTTDEINALIAMGFGSYALAEDLVIDKPIVVPAECTATLDLNGHNISNTTDIWNESKGNYALISVLGGNLTINGDGQVAAKANDCFAVDVWKNGNLVVNGGDYNGNLTALYVAQGTAKVNGGSYNIQQLDNADEGYNFELNLLDENRRNGTASIEVAGGKFYKFDPENNKAEGAGTNFVAPGYESVQDGDWYKVQPITPVEVSTESELTAALKATGKKNIAVKLMNDMELHYGARTNYGDANTQSVTIDGNGHTLNLRGTDTDWSSFGAWNGNLILKNMTVYKTEGGNGAWNNHAINLSNRNGNGSNDLTSGKIYLQNVTFNNSVAIQNDAVVENCTFNEPGAFYTFMVNANVKNTTIKDCKFIATKGGRGIKVIDQYVDEANRVQCNINISGCTFETAKKGAILVTNTAGAKITASNLDISKVAADNVNAVWNDEDRADYYDLVKVTGCTKKQE